MNHFGADFIRNIEKEDNAKNINNAFANQVQNNDGSFIAEPGQDDVMGKLMGFFSNQINEGYRWLLRQLQDVFICLAILFVIIKFVLYVLGIITSLIIGRGLSDEARERITRIWNHLHRVLRYNLHLFGVMNWNEADRFHAVQLHIVLPQQPQMQQANILD